MQLMTTYSFGDVLLVPFPFQTTTKKRPRSQFKNFKKNKNIVSTFFYQRPVCNYTRGYKDTSGTMAYTTDLSISQFEVLDQLLPKSKTKKNVISRHSIVNAIMYQLKNGCQWRDLPQDFPNWQTVYSQFRRWQNQGTWEIILTTLEKVEKEK
jgi:Putative transposase of IS4/5 family (DUF4096)